MNVNKRISLVLLLLFVFTLFAFAEYDSTKVKAVMQGNLQLMGRIGKAANSEDYFEAAVALMELAQGMISIMEFDPPRGTEEHWDSTLKSFVGAAFKGIGACGVQDKQGLKDAIAELKKFNGEGHKAHK